MMRGILARKTSHIGLIIVLGILVYANSINAPFQFDDIPNIIENPIIKDFGYFTDTGRAAGLEKYDSLHSRYIGFMTFFLNYRSGGLDVTGYHIVNIIIHIITALLVYALVTLSFKTPVLSASKLFDRRQWVALLAASLFVVHPVNTQAVTYIVQRFASLAAMFYLGSMVCYISSRLSVSKNKWFYYTGALVLAVLTMKTKENAFTLPVAILIFEFMFFRREPLRKRALILLPLLLTMLIIPLTLVDLGRPAAQVMSDISEKTEIRHISRGTYLLTELRVIVTYLRLLMLPINQNLDYDYPSYSSITQTPVLVSLVFITALMVLAIYLYRRKEPAAKLASFYIAFFFLALSVESTLVPLFPVFEHRAYLPGVGVLSSIALLAVWLYGKPLSLRAMRGPVAVCAVAILMLSFLTVARNGTWGSVLSLWSDVVEKAPENARGHYNLGIAYRDRGDTHRELLQYRKAVLLKFDYPEAHYNLAVRLSQQGQFEEAVKHYKMVISLMPDLASAYYNLGVASSLLGQAEAAEKNYLLAQKLEPDNPEPYYALGVLYLNQGDIDKGISELNKTVLLNKNHVNAHYLLGRAYANKGMYGAAEQQIQTVLSLDPQHRDAMELRNALKK